MKLCLTRAAREESTICKYFSVFFSLGWSLLAGRGGALKAHRLLKSEQQDLCLAHEGLHWQEFPGW